MLPLLSAHSLSDSNFPEAAYYQGAHAAVHPVGPDGAVGGPPIAWVETAIGAHAIQTDPSNQFAFVPHIDNRGGPNAIFQSLNY
jgi:hypothetical protein